MEPTLIYLTTTVSLLSMLATMSSMLMCLRYIYYIQCSSFSHTNYINPGLSMSSGKTHDCWLLCNKNNTLVFNNWRPLQYSKYIHSCYTNTGRIIRILAFLPVCWLLCFIFHFSRSSLFFLSFPPQSLSQRSLLVPLQPHSLSVPSTPAISSLPHLVPTTTTHTSPPPPPLPSSRIHKEEGCITTLLLHRCHHTDTEQLPHSIHTRSGGWAKARRW